MSRNYPVQADVYKGCEYLCDGGLCGDLNKIENNSSLISGCSVIMCND